MEKEKEPDFKDILMNADADGDKRIRLLESADAENGRVMTKLADAYAEKAIISRTYPFYLDAPSHLYKSVCPSVGPKRLLSDDC